MKRFINTYEDFLLLTETSVSKVLFLDIDGVIKLDKGFDKSSIENLNFIIEKYNPFIVISSDQRIQHTKQILRRILRRAGFIGKINDYTTSEIRKYKTMEEKRFLEINDYIKSKSVTNYVVVDDMSLKQYFKNRYIGTSYSKGFTKNNVKEIEDVWR